MRRDRRWPGVALLVVLLGGGWAGVRVHRERRLRDDLGDVARHMEAGRFATARRTLVDLTAEWPDEAEVHYRFGVCEQAKGDREAALAAWSRVPRRSEWFAPASAESGTTLINTGRYTRAERVIKAGLAATSEGPARHQLERALIRLYRFEGRNDDVRRLLRASIDRAPDPAAVLRELWLLDTTPFPLEAWKRALDHADAEDPRVWLGQAHVAILTGRYEAARQWLDRCLERRPDDPVVSAARLELARATDDLALAWEALAHVPTAMLSEVETLEHRAWLLAHGDDREAERRALNRLVALEPGRAGAWDRLATLASGEGRPTAVAEIQRKKGEIDRARDQYRAVLLAVGDLDQSAAELARFSAIMGRTFDARAWSSIAEGRPFDPGDDRRVEGKGPTLAETLADLRKAAGRPLTVARDQPAGALPAFTDDAESAGLRFVFDNGATASRLLPETMAGGVGLLDFDGDGWLDVFVVQGGPIAADAARTGDRLFKNQGDGTFIDATESSGIAGLPRGYGLGVAAGDYDNDGHPDLFLSRLTSYALWRNRGDGTFEDSTEAAGLTGHRDNPTSAAFADLDGDGDLDLYVCHYMKWDVNDPRLCQNDKGEYFYCDPRMVDAAPDRVFRNDAGRFVDVTEEAGFVDAEGRGLGVVAADLDGDDRIDLFVANDGTANYLYRNLGGFRFEEVGVSSGVASNAEGGFQASMGVACGDLDGDGLPELMVTNFYGEGTTLYRNLGGGFFSDVSAGTGLLVASRHLLGFGTGVLDFDNDRDLDVITVNGHVNDNRPFYRFAMPAQLLANSGDGHLTDVSDRAGPPWKVERVGRGLAIGDLDNDGRIDAIVLAQNEPLAYFHNRTDGGRWASFRLEGVESNRDGVGARVTVDCGGRTQVAQRLGGGSYQSANDGRLHFGLGTALRVESVEVRWPSGRVDRFTNLPTDATYLLREGEPAARSSFAE